MKKSKLKEQLKAAKIAAELANKVNDWYIKVNHRQQVRAATYEEQISAWCEEIEAELEDERNVNASLTEMYHNERDNNIRLQKDLKEVSDAYGKLLVRDITNKQKKLP